MRHFTIIIGVLLISMFFSGSASADYCSICVKDYCQTTYPTDNDGDGDGMNDAYEMQLARQFNSSLYVNRSNFKIVDMMQASMVMGSLAYLLTQGEVNESTSQIRVDSDSLKLKDPNKAAFYALVPGFFVHGAGHFYAGKSSTGLALLGVEMLSIASFCLYALTSIPDENETDDNFARQAVFLSMAVGLFLGSWYYDIEKTPKAVKEYNEKLRTKK